MRSLALIACAALVGCASPADVLREELLTGRATLQTLQLLPAGTAQDLDGDGAGNDRLGILLAGIFPSALESPRPLTDVRVRPSLGHGDEIDVVLSLDLTEELPPLALTLRRLALIVEAEEPDHTVGRFAARMERADLEGSFFPQLAALIGAIGDGALGHARALWALNIFDSFATGPDGADDRIEPAEVTEHPPLRSILQPELDGGEALSFGARYHAVTR